MNSLKMAFRDEVRPADFMARVWITAAVISIGLGAMTVCPNGGQLEFGNLIPLGPWHSRNPLGLPYLEIWSNILVNSSQIAFGLWGGILICMGIKRLLSANKFVFGCFFMAITFIGIAAALPSCVQSLLQIAIERYPVLMQ